ncbi:hypothetical protein Bca101_004306 [Brassica carinata]
MVTPKLPWDLESEILSRVPPTSLKRLQLTCKRWNTLFKDQRFINNHMGKATTQMVLKKDESAYSFSLDFHGLHNRYDQFITITGKLQSLKDSEDVKISKSSPVKFNSDSWRAFHDDAVSGWKLSSRGVSLKGNTYWLYSDAEEEDDLVNCILIFDFTTERFGRLSLPFHNDDNDAGVVLSVVREEKLALLFQSFATYSPSEMKIWVTNTKADEAKELSWSLFLVVDYTKVTEAMTRMKRGP